MERSLGTDAEHVDQLLAASPIFGGLAPNERASMRDELELRTISSGTALMKQGDPADGMYLVVSGRLQVVVTRADGSEMLANELGRGDIVGEMALITDRPRSATVYALRDSHLLFLSASAFARVTREFPHALRVISSALVDKLMITIQQGAAMTPATNIVVVPLDGSAETRQFAPRLAQSFVPVVGDVPVLTYADAPPAVGADVSPLARAMWREHLEAEHEAVVFVADREFDAWTDECVHHADLIVFVASARTEPVVRDVERRLREQEGTIPRRVELALLHDRYTDNPRGTRLWLANRAVDRHHHVRVDRPADYDRVARLLVGHGNGIVFSGGGARGIAHVGVVRRLREVGIPIDATAGVSIGAIVAGAVARCDPIDSVEAELRAAVLDKSPLDLTLPTVSLARGFRVTDAIRAAAQGLDVEDTWLSFLCVSTNLTRGELEVHDRGPGWLAIRSSFAVPGLFPPMQNERGDVLVDGGVLDNLPVASLRAAHPGISVIAVDVGARHEPVKTPEVPDGALSGWRHLATSLRARRLDNLTAMPRVLMRLTELGSRDVDDLGECYIRPAMENVSLLDFNRFDELLEIGARDTDAAVDAWLAQTGVVDLT